MIMEKQKKRPAQVGHKKKPHFKNIFKKNNFKPMKKKNKVKKFNRPKTKFKILRPKKKFIISHSKNKAKKPWPTIPPAETQFPEEPATPLIHKVKLRGFVTGSGII